MTHPTKSAIALGEAIASELLPELRLQLDDVMPR